MKKILVILLSMMLVASLFFACGPKKEDDPTDGGDAGDAGDAGGSSDPSQLVENEWKEGDLNGEDEQWFWFETTPGDTYFIYMHDRYCLHEEDPDGDPDGRPEFDGSIGVYKEDKITSYDYEMPPNGKGQEDLGGTTKYILFNATENKVHLKIEPMPDLFGGDPNKNGDYYIKFVKD